MKNDNVNSASYAFSHGLASFLHGMKVLGKEVKTGAVRGWTTGISGGEVEEPKVEDILSQAQSATPTIEALPVVESNKARIMRIGETMAREGQISPADAKWLKRVS